MDHVPQFAVTMLNENPYFSAGAGLFGIGLGVTVLRRFGQIASLIFRRNFTLTLEVASYDTAYPWILHWLASKARTPDAGFLRSGAGQHLSIQTNVVRTESGRIQANFDFIPSTGVHYIFDQKRFIRVERVRSQQTLQGASSAPFESVTLTTIGRDTRLFSNLLEEARATAAAKEDGWTIIYKAYGSEWRQFGHPRRRRPLESVILKKGIAESIITDIKEFIDREFWYNERGIPYRRGYLLYGPPGCGKSSFIISLAGHLEYSICVLNLSELTMSADRLEHLLTQAPLRSFILLEDVDAAVPNREDSDLSQHYGHAYEGLQSLTLSGLLNALDGVASSEGRILFMTTNYVDRLDPALIRPGRVDFRVEVGCCTKEQLGRMFSRFYPITIGTIHPLSENFAEAVGENIATPAQIQGYLLRHKENPQSAITDLSAFKSTLEAPLTRRNTIK